MSPFSKSSWLLPHMKFVEDCFFRWIPALPMKAQRWEGEQSGPWQMKQRWNLCICSQQLNNSSTGEAEPLCLSLFCMNTGTLVSLYYPLGIQQLPALSVLLPWHILHLCPMCPWWGQLDLSLGAWTPLTAPVRALWPCPGQAGSMGSAGDTTRLCLGPAVSALWVVLTLPGPPQPLMEGRGSDSSFPSWLS